MKKEVKVKEEKEQSVTQDMEKWDPTKFCCCDAKLVKQPSLEEELEKKGQEIEKLKKELARQEKLKNYDEMTRDIRDVYDSFVKQGFTGDQAFEILMLNMKDVTSSNLNNPYRVVHRPIVF